MIQQKKGKYIIDFISDKTNKVIYSVNKKTKIIRYIIHSDEDSEKPYDEIIFIGFDKLPSGFYTEGFGITTGGWLIDKLLKEKFGDNFKLVISAKETNSAKKLTHSYKVVINFKDFKKLQDRLKEIKTEKNKESENATQYYFNKFFPTHFASPAEVEGNVYSSGDLASVLTVDGILENLSSQDIKALDEFYPAYYNHTNSKLSSEKKLYKITKDKKEAEVVYLENIIGEFEKKIKQSLPESSWQTFLREYILLFNTNYTNFIEKANINLASGRFPDFMLIDVYNYLDIYEIKKPTTSLLREDKDRNNYYWDSEITKAISQVENYIHTINKNSAAFREEIKRTKKLDIRVVKPRGIVIAGTSKQFKKDEVIEDNFRLLNQSLKNVEIILYDELLSNLQIFLDRLKSDNKQ
jgi:Fe-S cluster biosynthesis and repair protein YggX